MTNCRITPFTIDTQTLPTAKTLHAFCSGAAHIFAVVLQQLCSDAATDMQ